MAFEAILPGNAHGGERCFFPPGKFQIRFKKSLLLLRVRSSGSSSFPPRQHQDGRSFGGSYQRAPFFSELHGSFRSPDRCGALVLENNEVPCRSFHVAAGTPVIPMGLEGCCRSRVHVHVRPQSFGICHGFNHGGHAVEKRIAVSQKENTAAGACRNTARPGGGCGRLFPGLERAGESCPGKNQQQEYLDGRHHGFRRVPMFPE